MDKKRHDVVVSLKVFQVRELIVKKNDNTVKEVNQIIFEKISSDFKKLLSPSKSNGKCRCVFNLTKEQEDLIDVIQDTYGINLTQLYINAIIAIAKDSNLI